MCAILGTTQITNKTIFNRAFSTIESRGKEKSFYTFGAEMYAYSRLPTDGILMRNKQKEDIPLLLYNGIIYNTEYLQEKFHLTKESREFDTRALCEGLQKYGTDFLSYCRGMFAFAYITKDSVVLGRDTVGVKPLYYAHERGVFSFASELKALTSLGVYEINEVAPGTVISYRKKENSVSISAFTYTARTAPDTIVDILYESLITPTRHYLKQSRNDVGLLVSGGLDSSILLTILKNHLPRSDFRRIVPVCITRAQGEDAVYARILGKSLRKKIIFLKPYSDNYCLSRISDFTHIVESPYARSIKVAFLQDRIAKFFSKKGIQVVISGEGADELFFGYKKFINCIDINDTDSAFQFFYKEIFPKTLLQRLDRVFGHRNIEARVPFLDQELVELARTKFKSSDKFRILENGILITKVPLREFADILGLPEEIINREKIPMTLGVTSLNNTETPDGFLEAGALRRFKKPFAKIVSDYFREYYGNTYSGKISLAEDLRTKENIISNNN